MPGRITLTLDDALKTLYAVSPDEFIAKRKELVDIVLSERGNEDAAILKRAQKPTVAAWIVNVLALADHDAVVSLVDVGQRLRAAQEALEADELRALTAERYRTVAAVTRRAFELAGPRKRSATLTDDVRGTFDAAVADIQVARRLGRLVRAEQYSGFGFGPGFGPEGTPQLTLVQGGREKGDDGASGAGAHAPKAPPKETAAQRRRRQRVVQAAQDEFDQADAEVAELQQTVAAAEKRVTLQTREIERLRDGLEQAKTDLEQDRLDLGRMKKRRQQARRDLDRAERGTPG